MAVFAHVTRRSLRAERTLPEVVTLVGAPDAAAVAGAEHMPSYASARLALLLRDARDHHHMDPSRSSSSIASGSGCSSTPVGASGSSRRRSRAFTRSQPAACIAVYLLALPLALVSSIGWFTPIAALFITYPILAVEQIGAELQIPFAITSLSHLSLDEICCTIERNVLAAAVEVPLPPGSAPTRWVERRSAARARPLIPARPRSFEAFCPRRGERTGAFGEHKERVDGERLDRRSRSRVRIFSPRSSGAASFRPHQGLDRLEDARHDRQARIGVRRGLRLIRQRRLP